MAGPEVDPLKVAWLSRSQILRLVLVSHPKVSFFALLRGEVPVTDLFLKLSADGSQPIPEVNGGLYHHAYSRIDFPGQIAMALLLEWALALVVMVANPIETFLIPIMSASLPLCPVSVSPSLVCLCFPQAS
jgi:hypothetical protein